MKKYIPTLLLFVCSFGLGSCSNNNTATTTGFLQEMRTEIAVNNGPARSGQEIYNYRCKTCHERNTQGAPMPGDDYEWQLRAAKGFDVLIEHTILGYQRTLMPAKGGCKDCTEIELRNAVIYMLKNSGIEVEPH